MSESERQDAYEQRIGELEQQAEALQAELVRCQAALGQADAKTREAHVQLSAANAQIQLWGELNSVDGYNDALVASKELKQAAAELQAVQDSTSWRLLWAVLTPYRKLRQRQ